MMEFTGPAAHGVVTVTASGTLTRADYECNLPTLGRLLDEHGALHFLIVFDDLRGFTISALWADLKFDLKYRDRLGRQAVVGTRKWQAWATRLANPFFREELRYFDEAELDAARAWVRGGSVDDDE